MEQDAEELFARYGDMIYRIALSYRNSVQSERQVCGTPDFMPAVFLPRPFCWKKS